MSDCGLLEVARNALERSGEKNITDSRVVDVAFVIARDGYDKAKDQLQEAKKELELAEHVLKEFDEVVDMYGFCGSPDMRKVRGYFVLEVSEKKSLVKDTKELKESAKSCYDKMNTIDTSHLGVGANS